MIAMEEVWRRWESYGQGCLHLLVSYGMGMCKQSSDGAFLFFLQFAGKVAAAREAIGDSDFFLVARTDARVGLCEKHGS